MYSQKRLSNKCRQPLVVLFFGVELYYLTGDADASSAVKSPDLPVSIWFLGFVRQPHFPKILTYKLTSGNIFLLLWNLNIYFQKTNLLRGWSQTYIIQTRRDENRLSFANKQGRFIALCCLDSGFTLHTHIDDETVQRGIVAFYYSVEAQQVCRKMRVFD